MLMSVDSRLPLPGGFELADLRAARQRVLCRTARPDYLAMTLSSRNLPLVVDTPPPARVPSSCSNPSAPRPLGAKRVEVPFEAIAPPPTNTGPADSRRGIDVPLGAPALRGLQHLKLGPGHRAACA